MDSPTCPICVTPFFGGAERSIVTCNHCRQDACSTCVGEYLMSVAVTSDRGAPCMHCRAPHTLDFLEEVLQKKFVKGSLNEHRKVVLLRSEMERMQLSQPFMEHALAVRQADAGVRLLEGHPHDAIAAARRVRRQLQLRIGYNNQGVPHFIDTSEISLAGEQSRSTPKRPFIFKCPKEGCRGFMDASFWCGLCETAVCAGCRQLLPLPKEDDVCEKHVCNPDDVSSVRHIAQVSKQCPKCGASIIRSEGCDQMWCTAPGCETAFSYSTGAIITRDFHNPHFREFLDSQRGLVDLGRDGTMAGGCAGAGADGLDEFRLAALLQRVEVPTSTQNFVISVMMLQNHIFLETLPNFHPSRLPPQWVNHDLRMRYLDPEGSMSEASFKRTLLSRDNTARFKAAVHAIFDMVRRVCRGKLQDLVFGAGAGAVAAKRIEAAEKELRALVDYANGCLRDVCERFNRSVGPTIKQFHSYNAYNMRDSVESLAVVNVKMGVLTQKMDSIS